MDDNFWKEVERARRMTPDECMREGFRLFEQGRDFIVRSIRETFPEATDDDVQRLRGIVGIVLRRVRIWGIR